MTNQSQRRPGQGLTDEQIQRLGALGQLMGSPNDSFDAEVERLHNERHKDEIASTDFDAHARDYEANYLKMKSAQTGGSLGLGPSDIEQEQAQGRASAGQQQALQKAKAAQAAQAQVQSPTPPGAPAGPAGVTQPYPAQKGPQPAPAAMPQQEQAAPPEEQEPQD